MGGHGYYDNKDDKDKATFCIYCAGNDDDIIILMLRIQSLFQIAIFR